MAESINLRVPIRVIGADGTVLFTGAGVFGIVYTCKATQSAGVAAADGVSIDPSAIVIPGGSFVAAVDTGVVPEAVYAARKLVTGGTADKCIGIALTSATQNQEFVVAGVGSLSLGLVAAGIGTVGQHAVASATPGQLASAAAALANPSVAAGIFLLKAGTTGGSTDTGNNTRACLLVTPHAA